MVTVVYWVIGIIIGMTELTALMEEMRLMRNELRELKEQQAAEAMQEDDRNDDGGEEDPQWGEVLPNEFIEPMPVLYV